MVEGSGLENRQGRKSFVSSNLTHAALRHTIRQDWTIEVDGQSAARSGTEQGQRQTVEVGQKAPTAFNPDMTKKGDGSFSYAP